jgi:peptidoglycan/LPS O-acetylase OafA/YrhL
VEGWIRVNFLGSMAQSHPYLNNLTPLRGVAALWVAVYHFNVLAANLFPAHQTMLVDKGYIMVDLFFIMSGFIIRHVYGDSFASGVTRTQLWQFFVARFARIYPLHFFTLLFLVIVAALSWQWDTVANPAAIPIHLLLLQSFGIIPHHTWNVPSWSISAEWAAYSVFPWLALLFCRRRLVAYVLLPVLIVVVYVALMYWLPVRDLDRLSRPLLHNLDVTYDYGFLRGLAGFCTGMLGYWLYEDHKARSFFSKDAVAVVFVGAVAFLMHKDINDLLLLIVFLALTLCFAANSGYLHQLCALKPIQFVGEVSYSIYLMQRIALILFTGIVPIPEKTDAPFFQKAALTIGYLLFLVGVSSITYFGIEKPCRNFINRKYRPILAV